MLPAVPPCHPSLTVDVHFPPECCFLNSFVPIYLAKEHEVGPHISIHFRNLYGNVRIRHRSRPNANMHYSLIFSLYAINKQVRKHAVLFSNREFTSTPVHLSSYPISQSSGSSRMCRIIQIQSKIFS